MVIAFGINRVFIFQIQGMEEFAINEVNERFRLDLSLSEKNYGTGHVQCCECRNLESFWKNGKVAFFMCRVKPVAMKQLDDRWRRCQWFIHTNDSPLERKNEIK